MQLNTFISAKTERDEFEGEKLINKFRFVIALLYVGVVVLFAVLRHIEGLEPFPPYGYIPNNVFLLFSVIIFIYLRNRKSVHRSFKYFCVIFDMTLISASIYIGCSYPHLDPPIPYLSIWALFYFVLILLGAFRYSVRCAVFSGIYAGVCYFLVVMLRADALDMPYFYNLPDGSAMAVSFPSLNESFRFMAMIVTGAITGVACSRHLKLFSGLIETQSNAAKISSNIVKQTQGIADTIRKSTDDIFLSSKDIFTTANNQAVSIQEIEATIRENRQITAEIAEKTSDVASIASKMETDVNQGFALLKRNVEQLEDIKSKNDGVVYGIITLGNKMIKISDIIEIINAITDQTKVIAFNAALEAASAGEYGRRFSLVSSEVNRLADNIASLTKEIRKQADDIHRSSSSLITSGKESASKINYGNNLIKKLEEIFNEIRKGADGTSRQAQTITLSGQQQLKSTEQINTAIKDITTGHVSFIQSTKIATSSAEELTKLILHLGDLLTIKKDAERNYDQN
ncbi:MAG: methyl-accepting chemotaxis protein [Treponema sp.]|nr:methyl-accepting chemotaxis protein [Treponema sp.]